jgi:dUTP pyrophosphatase
MEDLKFESILSTPAAVEDILLEENVSFEQSLPEDIPPAPFAIDSLREQTESFQASRAQELQDARDALDAEFKRKEPSQPDIEFMLDYASTDENGLKHATPGSAGFDVYANEYVDIYPGKSAVVSTGLHLDKIVGVLSPFSYAWQVWPRSGMSVETKIETGAGLIDSDFRGEVKIHLYNFGDTVYSVVPGYRIAQIVPVVILDPAKFDLGLVDESKLSKSLRGKNGFGSTGV